MEKIRINKYIASCGICSRRSAEEYVLNGRVKINGQVVTSLSATVGEQDIVEIDNKKITIEKEKIYIMLNKPSGFVTTVKEQFNRPSVLDIIDLKERVFPVGRLDMDSEGLLLITNDGDFANRITHPTKHVTKTYEVIVKNNIGEETLLKLKEGVDIGGYVTKPAIIKKISSRKLVITISEGKNRQIRKMIEAVENSVIYLKRISIGKLNLGNLKPGEYVYLKETDIEKIFK